jgi:hypothetical protein
MASQPETPQSKLDTPAIQRTIKNPIPTSGNHDRFPSHHLPLLLTLYPHKLPPHKDRHRLFMGQSSRPKLGCNSKARTSICFLVLLDRDHISCVPALFHTNHTTHQTILPNPQRTKKTSQAVLSCNVVPPPLTRLVSNR